jgi:hypothetical protein
MLDRAAGKGDTLVDALAAELSDSCPSATWLAHNTTASCGLCLPKELNQWESNRVSCLLGLSMAYKICWRLQAQSFTQN